MYQPTNDYHKNLHKNFPILKKLLLILAKKIEARVFIALIGAV